MTIELTFYDVARGNSVVDGPYDSLQLIYDLLRDDNDRTVAERVSGGWVRAADGMTYTDLTFGIEP